MEKEKKGIRKGARYPIFLLGLVIIIIGGLAAQFEGAPVQADFGIGAVGLILLLLSVLLR